MDGLATHRPSGNGILSMYIYHPSPNLHRESTRMVRLSRKKLALVCGVMVVATVVPAAVLLSGDGAIGQEAVSPFFPDVDPKLFQELNLGFFEPSKDDLAAARITKEVAIQIAEERDGIRALDATLLRVHDYGKPPDVIERLRSPASPGGPPPVPNTGDIEALGPGPGEHFECLCWVVRWDPDPIWWTASNPLDDGRALTVIWYPALVVTIIDAQTGEINWSAATGERVPTEEYHGGPLPPPWGK
jgi:hypothetical protein